MKKRYTNKYILYKGDKHVPRDIYPINELELLNGSVRYNIWYDFKSRTIKSKESFEEIEKKFIDEKDLWKYPEYMI